MNYSHLIYERSLTTTPHRQKPIIEPPDYPVVFLTQKNKSDRVQLVFFVVEVRDLPYSDCYRRSIACSRRGSHGNAVLRFFKIAINPRFDDIKKQVEQGSTCLLCGGDAGIWTPVHPTVLGTFYTFSWWLKFFLLRFTYKPCFDDLVITTILPRNRIALSVFLTPIAEGTENLRSTCWLNYAARANSIEELFWLFFAFNFNVPF